MIPKAMLPLLTVDETAKALGVKAPTIRQRVWRREISFVRVGRSIRFKPETIQELIDRGTVPALETR